ncbi:NB-ARC domain-containing protein [Ectobacillus sp. sgz5001026]|uniref:tetratricopeptide repeat protein n=1 Tax=Ectobacillus sp. sgz5001026 TaxID=3242473 RepID=UPI0036D35CCC
MYNVSATRLTLYAYISAIETDLRGFIKENLNDQNELFLFDNNLVHKLKERAQKNGDFKEEEIKALIDYLDFGDCISILNKFKKFIPNSFEKEIKEIGDRLEKITPIRNRVMHSRPLEFTDFPTVATFMETLEETQLIDWISSKDIRNKIKADPSSIFGIKIPEFVDAFDEKVLNNLPASEFDDTGFVGRDKDLDAIKKKILGNYPVISIIGDGGVGKTALTLKCLYELIDDPIQPFEAVIWISLKTKTLNNGEFINIKNTITSTFELYKEIKNVLIGDNIEILDNNMVTNEILEYMKEFKTLLVLDNLESINSESIREFLFEIPSGSKILTTSRIGIGEFEARHVLEGFNKKERVYYLRRLAQNYKLKDVLKMNEEELNDICEKLHSNPLAIKWFVANLMKGEPIQSILSNTQDLTSYCMSNVYDKLSPNAKTVLETLLIYNKDCSDAELAYLLELDSILHRKALNELMATNMIRMKTISNNGERKSVFSITDFAKEYLHQHCRPSNSSFKNVNKRIKELKALGQNLAISVTVDPYSPRSITYQSKDEVIAAYNLKQALLCSAKSDYENAYKYIDRAKDIDPNYFEIYKVSGFIYSRSGDYFKADTEYQTAIQCNTNSPSLLFLYAGFKMRYLEDFEEALELTKRAEEIDSENVDIKIQKARLYMFLGKFKESEMIFKKLRESLTLAQNKYNNITADLSAENCRRWSEIYANEDNLTEAVAVLRKSIDILENHPHQDAKMLKTISKIIKTLTFIWNQNEGANELLVQIIRNFGKQLRRCESYHEVRKSVESIYHSCSTEIRKELDRFLGEKDLNENQGYVTKKSKSYAFITNNKYEKLFLFWGDFEGEFSNLNIGDKVEFGFGTNDRGTCAKKCKKIK